MNTLSSVYLNLFHWPMGENSGYCNGVCRYVREFSCFLKKLLNIKCHHFLEKVFLLETAHGAFFCKCFAAPVATKKAQLML